MSRYFVESMGTAIGIDLKNFNSFPTAYELTPCEKDRENEVEICLYEDTEGKIIEKIANDNSPALIQETTDGRYCEIYNAKRKRTFCIFDNGKMLNYIIDKTISSSLHAFQAYLDIVFLHASAVLMSGKAYLFIAPSGGGKSTIATLIEKKGHRILSDDLCCVKRIDGKYYARIFPSSAAFGDAENMYEIGAFFFINKSDRNILSDLSVAEAIRKAMPEATNMYYGHLDPDNRSKYRSHVFSFLDSMFKKIRIGSLDFDKTGDVISCLENI